MITDRSQRLERVLAPTPCHARPATEIEKNGKRHSTPAENSRCAIYLNSGWSIWSLTAPRKTATPSIGLSIYCAERTCEEYYWDLYLARLPWGHLLFLTCVFLQPTLKLNYSSIAIYSSLIAKFGKFQTSVFGKSIFTKLFAVLHHEIQVL